MFLLLLSLAHSHDPNRFSGPGLSGIPTRQATTAVRVVESPAAELTMRVTGTDAGLDIVVDGLATCAGDEHELVATRHDARLELEVVTQARFADSLRPCAPGSELTAHVVPNGPVFEVVFVDGVGERARVEMRAAQ